MGIKNLGKSAKPVEEIWGKTLTEAGQDNYRKKQLNPYIPQVFAQDMQELRDEIRSMSKGVKKGEAGSALASGEMIDVLPIITLDEEKCIEIYENIFDKEKTFQQTNTFNGTNIGTDGIVLDKTLWNQMVVDTTKLLKGDWKIAPVKHQQAAQGKINSLFSKKLAEAEIKNRKGTNRESAAGREEIEQTYIQYRMSGYQSSRIKHGSKERYREGGLTDYEKSTGIQLGHADEGAPTWQHKVAHAEKIIKGYKGKGKQRLISKIAKIKEDFQVKIAHKEHITLNKLKKSYSFIITTGQRTRFNQKQQATGEAKLGSAAHSAVRKMFLKEHDTKFTETLGGLLVNKLTSNNKGVLNTSKRYIPLRVVKSDEEAKRKKKSVQRKFTLVVGKGVADFSKVRRQSKKANKKATRRKRVAPASTIGQPGSPLQILSLFNANLEEAIRENMVGGALHNRTGRFAGSVKVINLIPTAGTSGTAQYTYMKDPYQVFEGEGARDPRLLIDKTIREQAAEMALGKFTTQRV